MAVETIRNSYWVMPGEIMAGPFPGAEDEFMYKLRLQTLYDAGIRAFINLQQEGEMSLSSKKYKEDYSPIFRNILEMNDEPEIKGGTVRRFSIPDKSVPSEELMIEILDEIDMLRSENIPLYIHCWGGIGRTGTVVGCWLMRHGLAHRGNVLDEIFDLRKTYLDPVCLAFPSPETDIQEKFILDWEKGK